MIDLATDSLMLGYSGSVRLSDRPMSANSGLSLISCIFNYYLDERMLENDYLIMVAEKILNHFPHFSSYISYEIKDGENQLSIEIPTPNKEGSGMSIFASESEEIILFYSGWHCHFEALDEDMAKMFQQISDIFDEKSAFVNYLCFGQDPIKYGVFQAFLVSSDKLPFENTEYFYATEIEHISWRGTLNRKFYAPYIKT